VFIAIVFFVDLGCMLVNWGRLLILLLRTALAKYCVDQYMVRFATVRQEATLLCRVGYMLGLATHF